MLMAEEETLVERLAEVVVTEARGGELVKNVGRRAW
jgi:hypothetical protein